VEALLGTIDRPVSPARWRALGPDAVPVLAEIAASESEMPTTRAMALAALGSADAVEAERTSRALLDAPDAPDAVRQTAVRTLGRVLSPVRLRAALTPVLRADRDRNVRSAAAETLARHAPEGACGEVMDQLSLERAEDHPRFERAVATCAARR
jgi:HEAT repeat protein